MCIVADVADVADACAILTFKILKFPAYKSYIVLLSVLTTTNYDGWMRVSVKY